MSISSYFDLRFFLLALFLAHILAVVLFVQQHRVLSFGWKLPRFVAMVLTGTAAWHLGRTGIDSGWRAREVEFGEETLMESHGMLIGGLNMFQ
jgi:hypothetical protein